MFGIAHNSFISCCDLIGVDLASTFYFVFSHPLLPPPSRIHNQCVGLDILYSAWRGKRQWSFNETLLPATNSFFSPPPALAPT